ncbi:MAG: hypothetical protein H7X94_08095 [Vallitaleaceae bacterium]|nr:hypothetical protein [Vallitaleaceae bacterium]
MQIAFWSTVHGQTTTTANSVAMACMIALEYRLKTLITHNHFERSTLETSLLDKMYLRTELTELKDSGIDALSRFIKFNAIDKESILSYTTTILKGRLDLLMGTKNANRELYFSDLNNVIETILDSAKQYYDLLFVDVAAGSNELSDKILMRAELVVVNLNQSTPVLDDFFNNHYEKVKGKCFFLISMYDESSRNHLKNIQRKYKVKEKMSVIPYCRAFADACNEGRAVDFFMRNIEAREDDAHYPFIKEVRNSAECLLRELEIDINNKKLGD